MEFFLGIDLVLASLSVFVNCIVEDIESALSTSVTIFSKHLRRGLALVSRSMESMPIGFLNVKLRAPVTTNFIGITVLEGVTGVIDGGHEDGYRGQRHSRS